MLDLGRRNAWRPVLSSSSHRCPFLGRARSVMGDKAPKDKDKQKKIATTKKADKSASKAAPKK